MLISSTSLVKWNGHNIRYYISKKYNYTKIGEYFEVKIDDLLYNSRSEVDVECDYCGKKFVLQYTSYTNQMESYVQKIACDDCKKLKVKEVNKIKKTNKKPKLNKNTNIIITEEKLINDISKLIEKYGRFPKMLEIYNELYITDGVIASFGGMTRLRELLNYNNDTELIDKRGYLNSSTYEYMTAQFLIQYNKSYKREEHPFLKTEGNHQSDFTFYTLNGEEIHCEVWGYDLTRTDSKINNRYRENRENKQRLYNKYNLTLISVECEIFNNTYDNIQKELYNIFKPYLNMEFKDVNSEYLIPPTKVTDEELFRRTMELSKDGVTMPTPKDLRVNHSGLYRQINLRFGTWWSFTKHFGKEIHISKKHNYWNDERLYDTFIYILNKYNKVLNGDELQSYSKDDIALKGYYSEIKKKGKYIDYVLKFADKYIVDNISFNEGLNKYLLNIKNKRNKNVTLIQQEYANKILNNININYKLAQCL